jgi:hypothetical protein
MTARYTTAAYLRELQAKLSDQDLAVIKSVSDLRFMTGDQLARIHFADEEASARGARRALLRLTRLGCLERLPRSVGGSRSGSAGFTYRPGLAGQRIAMENGWQPERRRRRSHVPGTLFLAHSLAVAELHTLLIEADRSRRIELLRLDAEPACWRSYGGLGGQRSTLKPDSYLELGAREFVDSFFIEIDRDTEGSRTIEGKLEQYLVYEASGVEQAERGVFPLTLWLAPSAERVATINGCVETLPRPARRLFAVVAISEAITALATVTTTATQQ